MKHTKGHQTEDDSVFRVLCEERHLVCLYGLCNREMEGLLREWCTPAIAVTT